MLIYKQEQYEEKLYGGKYAVASQFMTNMYTMFNPKIQSTLGKDLYGVGRLEGERSGSAVPGEPPHGLAGLLHHQESQRPGADYQNLPSTPGRTKDNSTCGTARRNGESGADGFVKQMDQVGAQKVEKVMYQRHLEDLRKKGLK